jgi:quercetin dioxygenase-like cupin family protein
MTTDVARTGPIGYRQFTLEKVCQEMQGHKHNYDHTTFIFRGSVRVTASEMKDDKLVPTIEKEYHAGEFVSIPAELYHTIKALEPNTVWFCIYSHRDFDGLVTQRYIGNATAYQ